jgi:hypothetical protein
MKTRLVLYSSIGAVMLGVCSLKANITYDVNLTVGAGGIVGTITTDGDIGVLGASDILSWNLTGTGNGGTTFNFVPADSIVEVGNNTDVFNPNAGTPDLTATASHIYFNFSGTDGGYLGFQTPPAYQGEHYVSFGANTGQEDTFTGYAVVPVLYTDGSTINEPGSGNQIIASAATSGVPDVAGTMPLLGLGLGALGVFGRRFRK